MKIVLTREDVKEILLNHIYGDYKDDLNVNCLSEITFNDYILSYYDLVFEKTKPREWKESTLEDARDMAIEVAKKRLEQDEI